jgi:hypothetical protein
MGKHVNHTPFPWHRHENGGKLPGVYERKGGWEYGPEAADWVWGPKGPGYGVVADCSPHDPCTTQSRANAQLIVSIPDLIEALEACIDELPGPCGREGCTCGSCAREKAIKALAKARGLT